MVNSLEEFWGRGEIEQIYDLLQMYVVTEYYPNYTEIVW
jgi:hypothetical protein